MLSFKELCRESFVNSPHKYMSFSYSSTVPIQLLPGIGKRTAKVLRSLGILTVGQFKQLPESLLIELFGPSIKSVHNYVHQSARRTTKSTAQSTTSAEVSRDRREYLGRKLGFAKKFQIISQFLAVL